LLKGRLFESLLPLIDGSRTSDEIVKALQPVLPATHVYYALLILERAGCVIESDQQETQANSAFWSLYGVNGYQMARKLDSTKISIEVLSSGLSETLLIEALTAVGIQTGDNGNLTVALVDDYLDSGLEAINRTAIATGKRWIVSKPVGSTPWVGPLFNPAEGGCWACLAYRIRGHRDLERCLPKGVEARVSAPTCDIPLTRQIAYNVLVTEILKWIASEQLCQLLGKVLCFDTRSWQTETHRLVQRPECPACGPVRYRTGLAPIPVELSHRRIMFTADGGYRCETPDETIRRYRYHVSPITGVVRALHKHRDATNVTNAYLAVNSMVPGWRAGTNARRNVSGGKGMTDTQARASALCEALERYSAVYRGYEPSVVSTLTSLGDSAIHPNACMLYSDEQYRRRTEHNAQGSKYKMVPEPFDEDAELQWSPVWSLSRKEFRFLPTSYCYFGFGDHPDSLEHVGFCIPCSNGNAAGNTLEEAILQGVLELVERDSIAIWWYNFLPRPGVDLSTFSEPYFAELQEHYERAGRRLWILDITSDLGIPAFAAISSKLNGGELLLGFGCHLDARLGVARALTEANQMFVAATRLEADPEASFAASDQETTNWMKTVTVTNQPHVVPDPSASRRTAIEYRQRHDSDIRDAVLECQVILEKQGLEMLVLDQTRPDVELTVVKVIVPGLRHFWPRFAPGRLYQVPLKLGLLATPSTEKQLNPATICF
jgi:bacteriocin biosynthesis cyclodehydratase domain-containing protein